MDTPKLHVLTILSFKAVPITAETLVDFAEIVGFKDTPQSLRSRLVELERAGYAHRVDRNGLSRHNRPCWRWELTQDGRERIQQGNFTATSGERK
jgi:hypothetical protein|nr:MAG TPA: TRANSCRIPTIONAL REGULATOR SLYA, TRANSCRIPTION FACTOR, GLOBAL REGULATOR.85A [Caudoviricetes sp.]